MVIMKPGTRFPCLAQVLILSSLRRECNLIDIWSNPEFCYHDTRPDVFIINCKWGGGGDVD